MHPESVQSSELPKRLVIRLSSLGDVILSSAVLESSQLMSGVDWLVAREYADVLRGHPRIRRLWEFDRKSGLAAFIRLGRMLWNERYEEVIDLHGTLRAKVLRSLFWFWGMLDVAQTLRKPPRWTRSSKQPLPLFGFILFKKLWPRRLLSRPQTEVFARTGGGSGAERPNLKHLLDTGAGDEIRLPSKPYLCVMPSSSKPGKTWPAAQYFSVLKGIPHLFPVILGQSSDPESKELVELLQRAEVPHLSGVGAWNLTQVARVLGRAAGYLGSDTGLAHLAEAVGTEIIVVYGPTAPGLGFEPWRPGSRMVGAPLWCRPCGKIGQLCFRPIRKFHCLKILQTQAVLDVVRCRYPNDRNESGTLR